MLTVGTTIPTLLCICSLTYNSKASEICSGIDSPKFSKLLTDQTVKAGQNAVFVCAVSNFDHESDKLSWQVRPDIHRKEITEPVINFDVSESSVTLYDTGTSLHISCILEYQRRQGYRSQRCQTVTSATLLVEYFPDQNDLACTPLGPLELRVGDILSVRCEVPRCEPAVDLTWKLSDQRHGFLPLPSINDIGLTRVLRQDLEIDLFHHLNNVVCLVTSEFAFPSQKVECMIGPIKVLKRPSVDIYPSRVNVSDGDYFQLICLASGYPEVDSFIWSCSPHDFLIGCNSTHQNISLFVSRGFSPETDEITVRCTATNSEGSGTSNAVVTVLTHVFPNPLSDEAESCYSARLFIIHNPDPCCLKLSCYLLPNISSGVVEFQWIIDGQYIGHEDPAIRQESFSTSSFTFHNNFNFNANRPTLAKCQIKLGEGIFESSQNISVLPFNETSRTSSATTIFFHWKVRSDGFNPDEITTNIPFVRGSRKGNPAKEFSDPLEANSATPRSSGSLQQSTIQLSTWKLVSIIVGAVIVFIIVTIFSVTLVSVFLYYSFNKRSKAMHLTDLKVNNTSLTESQIGDPFYETADEPADTFPKSHHNRSSVSFSSSSSDEYGSSSSACYAADNGDGFLDYRE